MKTNTRKASSLSTLAAISCFAFSLMSFGQTPSHQFAAVDGSPRPQTTFTSLYSFYDENDGAFPAASLLLHKNIFYGTASTGGASGYGTVFVQAGVYHITLHSFGSGQDGFQPMGGLVMDSAGNIYGTTMYGGTGNCQYGCGTVFKVDTKYHYSLLFSFGGISGEDGAYPMGDLIIDSAGNLYGTTVYGGDSNCNPGLGCGTVFKITPNNQEYVLYRFAGSPDGASPIGHLARDSAGSLYGTTLYGGNVCGGLGCGTVFKLDAHNNESVLHRFSGSHDGASPAGGVVRDSAGTLYGTTSRGGASGFGTVVALSQGQESVLYSFTNGSDGGTPTAGVHVDAHGAIYGTTQGGGYGLGVVFQLDTHHNYSVLHRFDNSDGNEPNTSIVEDAAGVLYGTTYVGGAHGYGTIFKITP